MYFNDKLIIYYLIWIIFQSATITAIDLLSIREEGYVCKNKELKTKQNNLIIIPICERLYW